LIEVSFKLVTKAFTVELALNKQTNVMNHVLCSPAYTIVTSLPRSCRGVQLARRLWRQGNRKPYRQET